MGGDNFIAEQRLDLRGGICNRMADWDEMTDGIMKPGKAPHPKVQERWDEAKEVCLHCPVFVECHDQRLQHKLGVWGGTDPYERYLERRRIQSAALKARKREKAAAELAQAEAEVPELAEPSPLAPRQRPAFPVGNPSHCDAWVRDAGRIVPGWCEYVTPDGRYYRMKLKARSDRQTIKWVPTEDVDVRRQVTPEVKEWADRPAKERHGQAA